MNWRLKQTAFKALELLPRRIGDGLYHWFQGCSGSFQLDRILDENVRTFEQFAALLKKTGRSFTGKDILEVGSGWFPATPYLLLYRGQARTIKSYDIADHFSRRRLLDFNRHFEKRFGQKPDVEMSATYPLPQEIHYFPKTNLCATPPPCGSVDIVISRYVLQYIPVNASMELHKVFRRCLRPGGAVVHLVGASDDRAFADGSLSLYDFLKYSEAEWASITTRFFCHNRMRLPQYIELFQGAGFRVQEQTYKPLSRDSQEFTKFSRIQIHPDFARFTFEQLTASSLGFALC
jgi:SAM-dependent methyltransferase